MKWVVLVGLVLAGSMYWVYQAEQGAHFQEERLSQSVLEEFYEASQESRQEIAGGLEVPWALAFLPDGNLLVTERAGRIRLIDVQGDLLEQPVVTIDDVQARGEGGLLGIAVHPDFEVSRFVYVYYTYLGPGNSTYNRVMRMRFDNRQLVDDGVLLEAIPGAANHNGGRIAFGPDGYLYIGTGDAQVQSAAQDTASLAGKILRIGDDGAVPDDNPFGNAVWSYGHRNVQGLAWDGEGRLWASEHGRSGLLSGLDELNLIERGKNYGWPVIEGDETREGMEVPVIHSGPQVTWAPAGAAFIDGSIYFGGLRGRTLYQAVLDGERVVEIREHFSGEYGRIREVIRGPDNGLYLTTSNRDGRGNPQAQDDRIIRIQVERL